VTEAKICHPAATGLAVTPPCARTIVKTSPTTFVTLTTSELR
jgi:hypothetical protein